MNSYADRFLSLTIRLPSWAVIVACATTAALVGWAWAAGISLVALPALAVLALPLILSARLRLLVVVFGALLVFQTSDELTAPKLLYLFALSVSFGAVLVRLPTLMGTPGFRDLAPMLRSSVVLFALVSVSLAVSTLNEVPQKDWLRDIAPYVMVACAPFFALDAQASLPLAALKRVLVVAGTLGALGFSARWLTNRQIADLDFIPVGLPTLLLAATVFAYGIAVLLHGDRHRIRWAVATSLVFAMLLSTGTRTALILLAAPLAVALGARHRLAHRSLRLLIATPLVVLLVFLGTQSIVRVTNADREQLAARTSLLFSTGDTRTDRSYIERLAQTSASWEMFRSAPVVGAGPGTPIVWLDGEYNERSTSTVDSAVSFLAKFGLMGLVAAAFLVVGYVRTLHSFRIRTGSRTTIQFALIGFGAVVAAWSFIQVPFEDKGLAIGLIVMLAAGAREAGDAHDGPSGPRRVKNVPSATP